MGRYDIGLQVLSAAKQRITYDDPTNGMLHWPVQDTLYVLWWLSVNISSQGLGSALAVNHPGLLNKTGRKAPDPLQWTALAFLPIWHGFGFAKQLFFSEQSGFWGATGEGGGPGSWRV